MPGRTGRTQTLQTTSTNSEPWKVAQPYIETGLKRASTLLNAGTGFEPYPGSTVVPFSRQTRSALNNMETLARRGQPNLTAANDLTAGILGTGAVNDQQRNAISRLGGIAQGANQVDATDYNNFLKSIQQPGYLQSLIGGGPQKLGMEGDFRGLLGSGPNAVGQYGIGIASGSQGITAGSGLQGLLGQNPDAIAQNLSGIAGGQDQITTGSQLAALYNQGGQPGAAQQYLQGAASGQYLQNGNPYFNQLLDTQAQDIADQVNRSMGSMGRYGSGAHTGVLTQELGDFRNKALADQWNNERQWQMQAIGMLDSEQQQGLMNQLQISAQQGDVEAQNALMQMQAAQAMSGEQQQGFANERGLWNDIGGFQNANIGNQLQAMGLLSNEQLASGQFQQGLLGDIMNMRQGDINNLLNYGQAVSGEQQWRSGDRLAALGGRANVQSQNLANQLAANNDIFNNYNTANNTALNYMGMLPTLYDQQYAGADRLAQVGSMYEDLTGRGIQDQIRLFEGTQQAPWDQLAAYNALVGGSGQLGGNSTTTVTQPKQFGSTFANILGTILGGLGLFA